MLDLENAMEMIEVLETKLEWIQDDISRHIKELMLSLKKYEEVKKELIQEMEKVKTKIE